jgi:HPt (histidine-containing phosphotransfer) domain-containing protein
MSADSDHSMGQPDPGQPAPGRAIDWEPADLPAPEEPDWYVDDALAIDEPAWETPDPHDPPDEGLPQGAPFADGGWADALAPDPVLATLVDLVQRDGLDKLDDDQLTGVLQAAHRLAAWSASVRVAALSGLAARREQSGQESGDWRPFDHVDDEVAVALTLTRRSAARLLDLALSLDRLPLTRAALAAGLIDERRAEVIAEEVAELDDEQAAAVEKLIIGRAPKLTSGQLRALVRRAVLSADPKAAQRRKEKALKDARVEMFPETSGTAALAGRDLPSAGVLAADKHLTALAQAMKAAGQPGTLDILRAWAYLHLLSGKPAATLIPATGTPATGTAATGAPGDGTPGTEGGEPPRSSGPQHMPSAPDADPHFPAASGACAPGGPVSAELRGTVNLTMPLSAWLGWTESPGDVPGFGPIDAEDSRTLADLLAHRPANQWCVTLTDSDGHPVAHACARHGPPGSRPPVGSDPEPAGTALGPGPPTTQVPDWLGGLTFATLETSDCTHPRQSRGYQPSPSLRHLIQVRNPTCTGPGCRRPANRCDLDHVTPYDQGGKTCECNLHPACRHDHHTKQAPGWTVTCHQPGTLTWTTPGHRSYTTTPAEYLG